MLNRIELRVALAKKETSLAAVCRAAGISYLRVVRNLGGYGSPLSTDEEQRLRQAAGLPPAEPRDAN